MQEMMRWIRNYDRRRLDPNASNKSWISSKYDIENMHWKELQQIYLPSLGINLGTAWGNLKKLWKSYKISGRTGESRRYTAYNIVRIAAALGLEKPDFPELEGVVLDNEWDAEEVNPGWSTDQLSPLDRQLMLEEREAERESNDW